MSKKHNNPQQTNQPLVTQQPPAPVGFGGAPISNDPPADEGRKDDGEGMNDDEQPAPAAAANTGEDSPSSLAPARRSIDDAPICPNCKRRCRAASSPRAGSAYFTYYRCPTDGCTFSQKVPRPQIAKRLQADRDAEGFGAR